uniref:WAT1-related protein n=1 Tax=Zea mays TaxID=4577 RepID=A0A804N2L9_MAIZE
MGKSCVPPVAMVLVQLGFAGMNVVSKLALDAGMSPYVLIAYRNLIAAAVISPVAYLLERRSGATITKKVLLQIFVSSIFGATLNQVLYFVGLKSTSPTVACALTNTLPALTFVMAAALKMESVRPGTPAGQAKLVGTAVCVGGSMVIPFYKGPVLGLWASPLHWRFVADHAPSPAAAAAHSGAAVLGDVLIIASCVAWAVWFILHTKMSEGFSAPYTSTAIMCLMAGVQCAGVSAAMDRSLDVWKLGCDIRLYSVLYIVRGPLYVSMFSPLLLVVVAIIGWAILGEKIRVGTAVGSVLIVAGLYMVLWGKGREMDRPDLDNDDDIADEETAVGLVGFSGKGGGAVAIASSRVEAISLPVSFSTTSPKRLQHIHG